MLSDPLSKPSKKESSAGSGAAGEDVGIDADPVTLAVALLDVFFGRALVLLLFVLGVGIISMT